MGRISNKIEIFLESQQFYFVPMPKVRILSPSYLNDINSNSKTWDVLQSCPIDSEYDLIVISHLVLLLLLISQETWDLKLLYPTANMTNCIEII